ncbi:CotH kinase family protein [Bacteroidota bacterium]
MPRKTLYTIFFAFFLIVQVNAEIKEYFITCAPVDFKKIYDNFQEDIYIPVILTYNNQTWTDTEMRIRGESTRYDPKKSLKIKFNSEPFSNGRNRINLNAEFQDPSYIHSCLASRIFNEIGIPCFRSEHIRIYLNGEYLGLYLQIENMDEQFLQSRGLDKDGNLYKATNDGSCLSKYDDIYEQWEKKTNEDTGRDDLQEFIDILNSVPDSIYYEFTKSVFDYENMISIIAMNMLLANASTFYHNYYMYHDIKGSNLWSMFPWDIDKTFNTYSAGWHYAWSGPWVFPDNPYFERALLCDTIFSDIKNKLTELRNSIFNEEYLFPVIDSLATVLGQSVLEDKTDDIEDDLAKWNNWVQLTKDFINQRYDALQHQIENYPTCFRVHPTEEIYTDDVIISWERSKSNIGKEITYTLLYDTQPNVNLAEATHITGIKDTFYILQELEKGKYYWKVEAHDGDNFNEGFDKYNTFMVKEGTTLPCTIKENMTLTKEKSPYIADCNISVDPGVKLTIKEGVEIRFSGFSNLVIQGEISARGTSDDPILLKPAPGVSKWNELYMDSPTGACEFSFVEITDGIIKAKRGIYKFDNISIEINDTTILDDAVYSKEAVITFTNGYIRANGISEGVIVFNSEGPRVENCIAINTADSYRYVQCKNGIILNNLTINSSDDGIDQNGCINTVISGNTIISPNDKGISISHDSWGFSENILLEKNIIINAPTGLELKSGSTVNVRNNTFFNNGNGIHCFEKIENTGGPIVNVVNTIIFGSETNLIIEDDTDIKISYSMSDKEILSGQTGLAENNILAYPGFRDSANHNFHLLSTSPCIDSGDPDSPPDPDGTRADIGALYYNQNLSKIVINEINYNSAADFDTGDWVEFYNADETDVDMSGWIFKDSDDNHAFIFPDGFQLKKDNYIVLSRDLEKFEMQFPDVKNTIGVLDFGLSGSGELIRLYDYSGKLIDSVEYDDFEPCPSEADGFGSTLELINPALDNSLAVSWKASDKYGTPGEKNSIFEEIDTSSNGSSNSFSIKSIYPNPADNIIYIWIKRPGDAKLNFEVVNVLGYKVNLLNNLQDFDNGESLLTLLTGRMAIGQYYIKISNGEKSITDTFVIMR